MFKGEYPYSIDEKKRMTPVVAIRNFFGYRPGDTLAEFSAEVKQLSEGEKMELARLACEELGAELVVTVEKDKK